MPLEPAELADLIDRHASALRLWAGGRCDSPEDVVQEAFCRLAALEPPPRRAAAWLYTAVRNLAVSHVRADVQRRRRERQTSAAQGHEPDPAAGLMNDELVREVERLDDPLREVLVAPIWGDLTLEEIASLCGISTATAFRRYEAALEQIRKQMGVKCLNRIE